MSIRERYQPGGDKYESIKADEAWEKARAADGPDCCYCHIVAPCSWCVDNLSDDEEIVDISEVEG